MNKYYGVVFSLIAFLLLGASVFAQAGATVTAGSESSRATPSPQSANIVSGGTLEANVSAVMNTYRWAGFWGTVSGSITLADAGNNYFYNWTVSDPTGSNVYISEQSTGINWSNIVAASGTDMPTYLQTSAPDNFTNTFTTTSSITVSGKTVSNVLRALTFPTASGFYTYALKDASNNYLLWAATVNNDKTGYNGAIVDYQALVPEDGTGGDTTATTYYFYLELL